MPEYRIYFVDGGGRIVRAREIVCAGEGEARAEAKACLDGLFGIELWQGATMILKLAPDGRVVFPA